MAILFDNNMKHRYNALPIKPLLRIQRDPLFADSVYNKLQSQRIKINNIHKVRFKKRLPEISLENVKNEMKY